MMVNHNPRNVRIKRQYFTYLKEAMRQSQASVDASAESLARFEASTGFKDFATFRREQAIAFKRELAEHVVGRTGKTISKATSYAILGQLRRFFLWLAVQPGYRRLRSTEADFFNPPDKDARIATARRVKAYPTVDQVKLVISKMPSATVLERRDRAVVALTLLTGARDSAVVSLKLKHLDVAENCVDQDAREVNTKNSKTFRTTFFQVGDDIRQYVVDWVSELRTLGFSDEDPAFPSTEIRLSPGANQFVADGLSRTAWKNSTPVRKIFRRAFNNAGLPYFNPHSVRDTLVAFGQTLCRTPEEFKAWSQNLGHDHVLTTFTSYGPVQPRRQAALIRALGETAREMSPPPNAKIAEVVEFLQQLQRSS